MSFYALWEYLNIIVGFKLLINGGRSVFVFSFAYLFIYSVYVTRNIYIYITACRLANLDQIDWRALCVL